MEKNKKRVLIVDDSEYTGDIKIDSYKDIFSKLNSELEFEYDYELEFTWEKTIKGAINILNNKTDIFHVILIDYEFNNDEKGQTGIDLVSEIRKTINRKCKILFYTMRGYNGIGKQEYIELINKDVFRFISKSGESTDMKETPYDGNNADELIVKAIIDSIEQSDPISNALEEFLMRYNHVVKDVKINVDEKEYSIQDLINQIRLDTEIGKHFVDNALKMAIFDCLNVLE